MYGGEYSVLIGKKTRFFNMPSMKNPGYGFFSTTHSAAFPPPHIEPRDFAKRQCERHDSG